MTTFLHICRSNGETCGRPPWMTQKNYDACVAEKRLVWFEGVKHAESFFMGKERYEAEVTKFFADYVNS